MKLDRFECVRRVTGARFGVLGTDDETYGVHLVPVVFVVDESMLIVPVDTVKSKSSTRLRRIANLERQPRATLLVDHRDDDWHKLWWVRTHLNFVTSSVPTSSVLDLLADKYPQYVEPGAVASVLRFTIDSYHGWTSEV